MKLKELDRAREGISWAYTLRLKNGLRALKLRKVLSKMIEELDRYDAMKRDYIRETGKKQLTPKDPEFAKVMEILNEALGAEADIHVEPLITEDDLLDVEASAVELDCVIALGLFKEKPEPAPHFHGAIDVGAGVKAQG